MIGRCVNRFSHLVAAGAFVAAAVTAGFVTHPASALAAALDVHQTTHAVLFEYHGNQTEHVTTAGSVGEFLAERGIVPKPADYVHPAPETPLTDNIVVTYAPAIPVKLQTASGTRTIVTTASDVESLLEEQGIDLGPNDVVRPAIDDALVANSTVRVMRVVRWVSKQKHHVAQQTIHMISFALPPGQTRVIKTGSPGLTETMVDFEQTDGRLHKHVLGARVLRKPQPRVVADGVGTQAAVREFAKHGLEKTAYIASSALDMIATAYTAQCIGCTGYTASGFRAGHGIVAVDPRIIPLGTKLYIPGYGFAIAGDTGGAIVGHRIDLGFDSLADALDFGTRPVKVYTLK